MKTIKTWLFNPFKRVAGIKALLAGILIMALTALCAYFTRTHFDGVLDIHFGYKGTPAMSLVEQFLVWVVTTHVFFISGKIFSKSRIRFRDVAGTMALARAPMILGWLPALLFPSIATTNILELISPQKMPQVIAVSLVVMVPIVWYIVLLANAFRVSCNVRGTNFTWIFTGTLLVAEIISKLLWAAYITML